MLHCFVWKLLTQYSQFKEKPTITDAKDAQELLTCQGRISFSNVVFAYDERKPAIQNLSFTIEPGKSTAIVGRSGSGKSTCLKLLFRFYDIAEGNGRIEIDGHDLRSIRLASYRQHLAVVPQETILFNTTILDNLQYAQPDATTQEIYQACRVASIHDTILNFPDGYETKVGERGLRLSGGEKQRVCILALEGYASINENIDCHRTSTAQKPPGHSTR